MDALAVDRLALRECHGAEGAAVVRALHSDDVLPAGDRASQLDRSLDGLRAGVPEEERVKRRVRHHREQPLNELEVWLVETDAALRVDDVHALIRRGLADLRVAMAYAVSMSEPYATVQVHVTHRG